MSSDYIEAITVEHDRAERLAVRQVRFPSAAPGTLAVRVSAISLNRGEVKRALTLAESGTIPGWDFAGIVEDNGGTSDAPAVGSRVVGMVSSGSWAQKVHVPVGSVAVIPEGVTDAQAASLPVAGLTALYALRKGGLLLGRKVLIDGATGGVGQFAIQLAAAAGAQVYSHIRQEAQRPLVAASSTGGIIVGETLDAARSAAPFDLILDSVGGSALSAALTMLKRNGVCVTVGATEGEMVSFDSAAFFRASRTSLLSLILGDEIAATEPATNGLAILLRLVERGALKPSIGIEAPWTDIDAVARQLIDRAFSGKAILHIPI